MDALQRWSQGRLGSTDSAWSSRDLHQHRSRPSIDTFDSSASTLPESKTDSIAFTSPPSLSSPGSTRSPIPTLQPRLEKIGPYMTLAALQAYTTLTVVRCLADPTWIVLRSNEDKTGGRPNSNSTNSSADRIDLGEIGPKERAFLACAIALTFINCAGISLRIMDKLVWLRRVPVVTSYFQAIFCTAALVSFLKAHSLPSGAEYSHGFMACVITVLFSVINAIMLTLDWWKGFPSAGLSATLKALIISSFVMTAVIIIGAAIYAPLEGWTYDQAVNFCIVSFATIGYGNLSPKTVAGRIIFFFYGVLGISSFGYFIVSLRNAVVEQFEWRLLERFSKPAHLTRVQTRMSVKDLSYPLARFEEEQRVKKMVKRKMIMRMVGIWLVLWFGGAGVFCALEKWSMLTSLYFCFVTLTTIGFGDLYVEEPGAIEFWNVYVFIGLTVFAYILSLFSESMAAHIHLVDDADEDDEDDMYGWEQCEDPDAPLTTRSGTLGLEGQKWADQQRLQRPSQDPLLNTPLPCQQGNGRPTRGNSTGDNPEEEERTRRTIHFDEQQLEQQQQEQQQQQTMRFRPKRKSSSGRVLMVSAKERKQMLQAEYYANQSARNGSIAPSTVHFVDTNGVPHQRIIHRGTSLAGGPLSGLGSMTETTPAMDSGSSLRGSSDLGRISFGTSGYNVVHGRPRRFSLLAPEGAFVPEEVHPSTPGTLQTTRLQHQPQVRFESPRGSPRSLASQHTLQRYAQAGYRTPLASPLFRSPSLDVFQQPTPVSSLPRPAPDPDVNILTQPKKKHLPLSEKTPFPHLNPGTGVPIDHGGLGPVDGQLCGREGVAPDDIGPSLFGSSSLSAAPIPTLEPPSLGSGNSFTSTTSSTSVVFPAPNSRSSSVATDISIGPLDEVRDQGSILPFETDVDLNKAQQDPQEAASQEAERKDELDRRQAAIEDQLRISRLDPPLSDPSEDHRARKKKKNRAPTLDPPPTDPS